MRPGRVAETHDEREAWEKASRIIPEEAVEIDWRPEEAAPPPRRVSLVLSRKRIVVASIRGRRLGFESVFSYGAAADGVSALLELLTGLGPELVLVQSTGLGEELASALHRLGANSGEAAVLAQIDEDGESPMKRLLGRLRRFLAPRTRPPLRHLVPVDFGGLPSERVRYGRLGDELYGRLRNRLLCRVYRLSSAQELRRAGVRPSELVEQLTLRRYTLDERARIRVESANRALMMQRGHLLEDLDLADALAILQW